MEKRPVPSVHRSKIVRHNVAYLYNLFLYSFSHAVVLLLACLLAAALPKAPLFSADQWTGGGGQKPTAPITLQQPLILLLNDNLFLSTSNGILSHLSHYMLLAIGSSFCLVTVLLSYTRILTVTHLPPHTYTHLHMRPWTYILIWRLDRTTSLICETIIIIILI